MFYTIYKITNKINGKIYIGKHQTKNLKDGYMGSGRHLKRAIQKYGIENFSKEILFVLDTEEEMNSMEKQMVTLEFCESKNTYNICVGGQGGFSYLNSPEFLATDKRQKSISKWNSQAREKHLYLLKNDKDYSEKYIEKNRANMKKASMALKEKYPNGTRNGHITSEETKKLMSIAKKGKKIGSENSQYGTIWITDGITNKKIKSDQDIPIDWKRGRSSNKNKDSH